MSKGIVVGGDKWKGVLAKIAEQNMGLRVGIFENAQYAGEGGTSAGTPVAVIAAKNEFGGSGTPSRPFMRNTVREKSATWARKMARLMKGHPQGVEAALNLVGDVMRADIVQTIESSVPPALAKQTVKRKAARGKSNPDQTLVDTGTMEKAVAFEMVGGGKV